MKRRSFFGVLGALFAAPAVAALPAIRPAPSRWISMDKGTACGASNPLFRGEMGIWSGVSIIAERKEDQHDLNRRLSRELDAIADQWTPEQMAEIRAMRVPAYTFGDSGTFNALRAQAWK